MNPPSGTASMSRWLTGALIVATVSVMAVTGWLALDNPDAPLLAPLLTASILGILITLAAMAILTRSTGSGDSPAMRETLGRIDEHLALSDTARRFVYRERELEMLKMMVERDIDAGRFESALRVVDELARGYGLFEEADVQRKRIESIRHGQVRQQLDAGLQHIRSLVGTGDWSLATRAAERLHTRFPDAAETQDLTNQISAARHRYAAELEEQVRGALREDRIEEAMNGLRELDRHLVGDEVHRMADVAQRIIVAHREHCGSTFRDAVARHDWPKALEMGGLITTDYPNTRMAEEVGGLLPGIRWRVDPSGPPPQSDGSTAPAAHVPENG